MRALALAGMLLATGLAGCITNSQPSTLDPLALPLSSIDPASFVPGEKWSAPLVKGALAVKPVLMVKLPSFDQVPISLGVYLPDVPEGTKIPAIIDSSPYYGNGEGPVDHPDDARLSNFMIENIVPHGYAYVMMSVRGTGDSGSCNDFMGPAETADIDAVINWSATQPWSTGDVGMIGKSYDGGTAWEGAATGNPHLKTIVPLEGVTSLKTLHFANGTAEGRAPLLWLLYALDNVPASGAPVDLFLLQGTQGRSGESAASGLVCPEVAQALAATGYSTATGDGADPLGFWAARDMAPLALKNFHGSMYMVQGLQDFNVHPDQTFPLYGQFPGAKKLLLGQWAHDYPDRPKANANATRYDWAETLLRWFDHELKGKRADLGPAVDVQDNLGHWRTEATWPPADATPMTWKFGRDGTMESNATGGSDVTIVNPAGVLDPRGPPVPPGTTAPAVSFTGPVLTEDLRISGMPQVPLSVTPLGPGGIVAAELFDVQGADQKLIGHGLLNLNFADGTDKFQPALPGEKLLAKLQLFPLDVVVPAGHQVTLSITQNDASFGYLPSPIVTGFTLHAGESSLILPVIHRGPEPLPGWPYGPETVSK